jgi:hypothetical protein
MKRLGRYLIAAVGLMTLGGATSMFAADRDYWRDREWREHRRWEERREREWREHEWREHHRYYRPYYNPYYRGY